MRNRYGNIIVGLSFVLFGVIMLGNYVGLFSINVFFKGWWTLFLVIPALVGLFNDHNKTGSLILLIIGAFLLLDQQSIITGELAWKTAFAIAIIVIGLRIIFSPMLTKSKGCTLISKNSGKLENYSAIFGGQKEKPTGQKFKGANIVAIFGGIQLDLTDSIIEEDVEINVTAIFGGCAILPPKDVNVKVCGTNIFGGVGNKLEHRSTKATTIYVNTISVFGGVGIK